MSARQMKATPRPTSPARPSAKVVIGAGLAHGCETVAGGDEIVVVAGPCAVEGRDMLLQTANSVAAAGASALRGGAFKPRTSPFSFQGLGAHALELLAEARQLSGLPVVTEVMDVRMLELICAYADVVQIGARSMQNFPLLTEVGRCDKPVLLKRGLANTLGELLAAVEYIVAGGNESIILCERGIRSFESATRNTLDLGAVAVLKFESHLPVFVDPSHAAGRSELVESLTLAAIAAGSDGILVEVHPDPETALSDGRQSLTLDSFNRLMQRARPVARAVGRSIRGSNASVADLAPRLAQLAT